MLWPVWERRKQTETICCCLDLVLLRYSVKCPATGTDTFPCVSPLISCSIYIRMLIQMKSAERYQMTLYMSWLSDSAKQTYLFYLGYTRLLTKWKSCDMILTGHAMLLQLRQHGHYTVMMWNWLLTKKRRLKRNRKYLVTVMHPFPMSAPLEDITEFIG